MPEGGPGGIKGEDVVEGGAAAVDPPDDVVELAAVVVGRTSGNGTGGVQAP